MSGVRPSSRGKFTGTYHVREFVPLVPWIGASPSLCAAGVLSVNGRTVSYGEITATAATKPTQCPVAGPSSDVAGDRRPPTDPEGRYGPVA
jgi:hypothetical protein